ncbi:hypothetical protein SASPL_108456 [Salvia splendens]|uniref:Uncharacterized protein n=1 Tax=Salvia splendens TaxID=180675 RepID=A0A8X9A7G7_SALSN|nr:hypothetical protein SASPL_108456 [Salvia splendens]
MIEEIEDGLHSSRYYAQSKEEVEVDEDGDEATSSSMLLSSSIKPDRNIALLDDYEMQEMDYVSDDPNHRSGYVAGDGGEPRAHGGAVHEGDAFLGLELEEAAFDAGELEGFLGIEGPTALELGRPAWGDVLVKEFGDGFKDFESDAEVALEEGIDPD